MKKLIFFLSVFAWLISANIVYATVTAPNVTIQNGGAVSVVWNAPASQTTKVSVFIPNNATAINALYHVYPNGKSATNTACLSTDVTNPCYEVPLNQALNKNKWVQLTLNNDVNTQWTFVKNTGFVTVASNNLGASENLGVAGADFSVSALNTKQIAAKWAKAIAAASGIKKAIARCILDNGGIASGLCDYADYGISFGLGKYGIFQGALDRMNAAPGTEALINIGTTYGADANTMVSIDLTEAIAGKLGGCSFHLVPTRGVGTILWQVLAKMESSPAVTDADCTKFVNGSMVSSTQLTNSYGGNYSYVSKIGAKWAKAIAAASGIKKAINQCLRDNWGIALGLCDSSDDLTSLGKYGVTTAGLIDFNFNTEIFMTVGKDYGGTFRNMVSIDLWEASAGRFGGCSFHLVPTVYGGAGTIVWHVLAKMESSPAESDSDCTKFVKGSMISSSVLFGGGGGGGYAFEGVFRAKWAKAIAATSGIKKAINQCLRDNGGWALGICDSAGADTTTTLGKYGITTAGLDSMNAAANTEVTISVGTAYGGNLSNMVSIDLTENRTGSLSGCSFHLVPTVYGGAGTIVWQVLAQVESAPAVDDTGCASLVKGSLVSTIALGGGGSSGYIYQKAFSPKWAKAIATVSGIKKAITQCLKKSGGVALNTCDAAGNDSSKLLGKYGVTDAGLAQLNATANPETQVAIGNVLGDVNSRVSIDITEKVAGSLGGCSFHLYPTVIQGAGAAIIWHTAAMRESAPSLDDMECTGLVKGSEPMTSLLDGISIMKMYWGVPLKALSAVKEAISRCLIDNAGNKTLCNSVLVENDKLQKYGVSSLPAGTGVSDGAATTYNANWISMNMGSAGASNAAIIIKGGATLTMCKMTLQPTFDSVAKSVNWTVFAQTTKFFLTTNAKCASYINGAIAGAPI